MVNIRHLGHAGFKIKSKASTIYIDPYNIDKRQAEPADIILITHTHFDHCSCEDIAKINRPKTTIIGPSDCRPRLSGNLCVMRPGANMVLGGCHIHALPAYNISRQFHPKNNGWLGYLLEIDGTRIYHAGDTDCIPEMKKLGAVDYALLPVGGKYTMSASESARAAGIINPRVAVPMHYGEMVGTRSDAEEFKNLCSCRVDFLQ